MLAKLKLLLQRVQNKAAERWRKRQELEALANLDDDQLRDIGINPRGIKRRGEIMHLGKPEDWLRFPHW